MKRVAEALFVYGSLQPGAGNASELADIKGHWVRARARGQIRQFARGPNRDYPVLLPDEKDSDWIQGWVLFSPLLRRHWKRLDVFEGREYRRAELRVELSSGQKQRAHCYILNPRFRYLLSNEPVESGE